MGKVRKYRQKYHLSKVEASKAANAEEADNEKNLAIEKSMKLKNAAAIASNENIFAGLDINLDALTQSLPDFDAKSVISTKSRKELKLEEQHLKKKVKQKLRRERFMSKLDVTHQMIEHDKKNKKKGKKSGSEVQNPFKILMPSLKSLSSKKNKTETKEFKRKPKGIQKMQKRLSQQTSDVKLMSRILKDKKFMANPGQAITEYLKKKVSGK